VHKHYFVTPVEEPRIAVAIVEEKSEVEEPAVLEDYLILDEVTSESEKLTETAEPSRPRYLTHTFMWTVQIGQSGESLIDIVQKK
jgi:hypothetical protein